MHKRKALNCWCRKRSFFSFRSLVHRAVCCLENSHGTHKTHFIYLISQHCKIFLVLLFRPLVIHFFLLIDWVWIQAFQRSISLILLNTFQVVISCFFIGFVKLEAIKILVWCVLGKIAISLIFTHLDFVISLYKVTNRGSCISASCNVF